MRANRVRSASGIGGAAGGIPTNGLVAHYTMDNISGSTLIDETGNHDGILYNATVGSGYLGFNGSNTRIDVPTINVKRQSLSVFTDIIPDTLGENDAIFDCMGGYGAVICRFNSGKLRFYLYDGSTYRVLESPSLTAENGYKMVAQHDSVSGSELWINGGLVASAPSPLTIAYQGNEAGRRIGANYINTTDRHFDGKSFEYAEYDRLLISSEIAEYFS